MHNNFNTYFRPSRWLPLNKDLLHLGMPACIVYSAMWAYSQGEKGYCYASVARLASDLRISTTTVKRAQDRLEYHGLIKRIGGGHGSPIHYIVVSAYAVSPKLGGKPGQENLPSWDRLMELRSMPYAEYLQAEEWQRPRKQALRVAKYKCQLCGTSGVKLEVHHNSYENLGCERPDELIVLCTNCHTVHHGKQ